MFVLIPAYQPDTRLPRLISDLRSARPDLGCVVVDDGSGPNYKVIFDAARAAGATVLSYSTNRGKGYALRQGMILIRGEFPGHDVVTADADGQHKVEDICRVADEVARTGGMVLGVRAFAGKVPLRSRIGNAATSILFTVATGWRLGDTQTGLRGFTADQLHWLTTVTGDRYEYELRVLLAAAERKVAHSEISIETIYEVGNPTSHFDPVRDSLRIWAPLLKFTASSGAAFVIDYVVALVLHALMGSVLIPVVLARIASGTANFFVNRKVFRAAPGTVGRTAVRYLALALVVLAASYVLIKAFLFVGLPLWLAKPVADGIVYLLSFHGQRLVVFKERSFDEGGAASSAAQGSTAPLASKTLRPSLLFARGGRHMPTAA